MSKTIQQEVPPPHPGEILQELYLQPLEVTVTEVAEKLGITRPNLSSILNGKAGISPGMALKLSKALQTTPDYWMLLQTNYDLWKAKKMNLDKNVKVLVKAKKKPADGRL